MTTFVSGDAGRPLDLDGSRTSDDTRRSAPVILRLVLACHRRRRMVIAAWLLVLAGSAVTAAGLADGLRSTFVLAPGSESADGARRLETLGGDQLDIVGLVAGRDVDDAAYGADLATAALAIRHAPGVRAVYDHAGTPVEELVSADRTATIVVVDLVAETPDNERDGVVAVMRSELGRIDGVTVTVGGPGLIEREFEELAHDDLRHGEAITLPIVLVLLVLMVGGLIAAALPLVVAVVAVTVALAVLGLISHATDVSVFAANVASMLGLGLGIDYGLLMIARFREERARGLESADAVGLAAAESGRTIVFSGLTIAVSLAGLLAFREPVLRSFAYGGIGTTLVAVAASVTLLPALLGCTAGRIRPARRVPDSDVGRWARFTHRRAALIVPVVAALLVLLAVPFLRARLETFDARSLPPSSATRQVAEQLSDDFPIGGAQPVTVLAAAPADSPSLAAFRDEAKGWTGVTAALARGTSDPGTAIVDIYVRGPSQGPAAVAVVERMRDLDQPFETVVTGPAAVLVDYRDSVAGRLPVAISLMMATSFVLLFMLTGSVVVPLKALVMGLLSLGASFGALAWIFQDGHLSGLLGFEAIGSLDVSTPVLVFVFAFALSMDYEVFLLARVKETWDATGDNERAVGIGLNRAGRVVSPAALLMVVVCCGFATGQLLTIKQLGVGLAIAVALDATVIRGVLVPASMALLGRANWWAPAPLRRLHTRCRRMPHVAAMRPTSPPRRLATIDHPVHLDA